MADIREIVLCSCQQFMVPIARMLLRYGVGFREFAEVCKAAFVQVASDDYGIRGRKTNMSRVAIMTGLTRKEVRWIRDQIADGNSLKTIKSAAPGSILLFWHNDIDFLDSEGRPKDLRFSGASDSFEELVRKYAGDVPAGAMRTELLRAGAIEISNTGLIRIKSRYYIPSDADEKLLEEMGFSLKNLALTLAHNLNRSRVDATRFERYTGSNKLRPETIGRFKRLVHDRADSLLVTLDDWLAAQEISDTRDSVSENRWVGIGIYYFEDDDDS